ncbi:hypothetical protein PpBr36_07808 [Pyricularia pennisetigena]|uniref:hypothetical protein n=1 Tax=Pyricularia pennisetigena TaxID=1578925 RepID=UPI001150250E|nr:hypothetical protein PpBr36_07808 [Pyricularia pennisetigena]TLS26039.1 hypothetical protein PpBr36_07808 [Pyricularia pennisetigena]
MVTTKNEKLAFSEHNSSSSSNAPIQPTGINTNIGTVNGKSITAERIEYPEGLPEAYYRNFKPIAAFNLPNWQPTERALVRRRTNIAQAKFNIFDEDFGLRDDDYNIIAVFTIGYILFQLPSNILLTRVRPGFYLPFTAIIWSAVSVTITGALSGVLAAGIFSGTEGVAGLAGWQWLFIIESLISTVCGVFAFWTLPDYPHSDTGNQRRFITEDIKRLTEARFVVDRVTGSTGTGSTGTGRVVDGIKLAVTDLKTWSFVLLNIFITASCGFNFFFPTLVRGLGIGNSITSLLLTSAPYLVGACASFFASWNSDRVRERGYHICCGLLAAAAGYIVTVSTDNMPARYAASFLFAPGSFSANALVYTWAVSTLGATPEKRAAAGAIVNIFSHFGNVVSPYFFRNEELPVYRSAFVLMPVFGAAAFGIAFGSKMFLRYHNKKLRKRSDETGEVYNPYIH